MYDSWTSPQWWVWPFYVRRLENCDVKWWEDCSADGGHCEKILSAGMWHHVVLRKFSDLGWTSCLCSYLIIKMEAVCSCKMLICNCHIIAWCHNPKSTLWIHTYKVYFGWSMYHTGLKSWEGAACWVDDSLQDLWRGRVKLMNGSAGCMTVHLCTVCLGLELKTENVFMKIPCCNGNTHFA